MQMITKRGRQGEARVTWGTQLEVNTTPKRLELNMAPTATRGRHGDRAACWRLRRADGTPLKVGDPVTRFDCQDEIFRTGTGGTRR